MNNKRSDFLNAPNLISLFRLAMAPFLFLFLYLEKFFNPAGLTYRIESEIAGFRIEQYLDGHTLFFGAAAAVVFLIAAVTDLLDGYVARKTGCVTDIGKFLDPLADKVMVTTALILLVGLGRLPAWIALIIVLREMVITGLRGVASTRGTVIAASSLGKSKTVFQNIAIVCLLIHVPLDFKLGWFSKSGCWMSFHNLGTAVMYVAIFYTLYSGYDYIHQFIASESANGAGGTGKVAGGTTAGEGDR